MEQHERTVVDGTHHHMHVRHLTLRGTNYEIGRALGEIAMNRHRRSPDHVRGEPRYVRTRRRYIQQTYPLYWERMRGVAAAFGLKEDDDSYDWNTLMYGVDAPQTHAPSPIPPIGCSVVYYPPATTTNGSAYLSRNFDFSLGSIVDVFGMPAPDAAALEPMVRHPYVLELHPTDGGYASIAIQAFDLVGGTLDGMNDAGLVVAIMADADAMAQIHEVHVGATQAIGLHELQVMRYVLDTCATAEEAMTAMLLVKQYYQLVPCHYLIGDRHGNSFVYENSTGRNLQYIIEGMGQPQVVTNFQLHQHPSRDQLSSSDFSLATEAFWRYATLTELLHQHNGGFDEDRMKAANACVSVQQMFKRLGADAANRSIPASVRSRTLWHSLYNVEQGTVAVDFYLGETCNGDTTTEIRSGYYEFALSSNAFAPARRVDHAYIP